jgi:hypothetical protein
MRDQISMFAVSLLSHCWCKHDARVADGGVVKGDASAPAVHRWLRLFSRDFPLYPVIE